MAVAAKSSFLPKETRGYVPGFIAMTYMMTHHLDHNILPIGPIIYDYTVDTVCLKAPLRFSTVDSSGNESIVTLSCLVPIIIVTTNKK